MKSLDERGKIEDIFDGQIRVVHFGTGYKEMNFKGPSFAQHIGPFLNEFGIQNMVQARTDEFNNRVIKLNLSENPERGLDLGRARVNGEYEVIPSFYRAKVFADGVVFDLERMKEDRWGLGVMSGDCGFVKVLGPNGAAAFLHAGLRCLVQEGPSLIANGVTYFIQKGISASELRVHIGEGIRGCCYGVGPQNDTSTGWLANLRDRWGSEVTTTAKHSPRKGEASVDIPFLAAAQASSLGVRDIQIADLCTSCHGVSPDRYSEKDHFGTWWSNTREDPTTKSNRGFGLRNAGMILAI